MFRTTEISDPKFESNHLRFITVKSENLKGRGDICVFVPPNANLKDIPLVILLHGVYGSSWVWSQKGGVHLTASDMMQQGKVQPMVIAMPSDGLWGDGSGYMPHNNEDYEKWIVEDVPNAVFQNIHQLGEKSSIFISGLSMGGFGALRLGVKYSHIFKAVSAHSAITSLEQMPLFVEEALENYDYTEKKEQSIFGIIQKYKNKLPGIRFDCGKDDLLIEHNRLLHGQLNEIGIDHIYEEFSGSHEWSYWQEHIKDSLLFFDGLISNSH